MNLRLLGLVTLVVVAPACGSGEDPVPDVAAGSASSTDAPTGEELSLEVDVPTPLAAGGPVTWRLVVTNRTGAGVTLSFPSGQQGEVVLTADDGSEAYRWSEEMMFSQAIAETQLAAGAEVTFTLEGLLDVEPGTYDLEASVPSDPAPGPVRQVVTVRG